MILSIKTTTFGISYDKLDWNSGFTEAVKPIIKENNGRFNWEIKQWIVPITRLGIIKQYEKDWYKEYYKDTLIIPVSEYNNIDLEI